jgi:hypothetical protein
VKKAATIFAEVLLAASIVGLLVAMWLPIPAFRAWLTRVL